MDPKSDSKMDGRSESCNWRSETRTKCAERRRKRHHGSFYGLLAVCMIQSSDRYVHASRCLRIPTANQTSPM